MTADQSDDECGMSADQSDQSDQIDLNDLLDLIDPWSIGLERSA